MIDNLPPLRAAYGTSRGDTQGVCGDVDNGFGLTFNWNIVGDEDHRLRAFADGEQFADVTFTVATLGVGEFPQLEALASSVASIPDFPSAGTQVRVQWQDRQQNFIIEGILQPGEDETVCGTRRGVVTNSAGQKAELECKNPCTRLGKETFCELFPIQIPPSEQNVFMQKQDEAFLFCAEDLSFEQMDGVFTVGDFQVLDTRGEVIECREVLPGEELAIAIVVEPAVSLSFKEPVQVLFNQSEVFEFGGAAGSGTFSNLTSFSVGRTPQSVAVGDFNRDSLSDLAVGNFGSSNVSILLGDGTGGFSNPTNFRTEGRPRSIAVRDFNRDSLLDLAIANEPNFVAILLGDGTGGFSNLTNFEAGPSPLSVAVGDFNQDSILDLAVANGDSPDVNGGVSILLGDGTGGFSNPTNFELGGNPQSVAIGDFNRDSFLDLAAARLFAGNVSILLGDGTGEFSNPTNFELGGSPRSIAVRDFNRDSLLDLAVTNEPDFVSILLGDGTGGFSGPTNFGIGSNPFSVVVKDFDRDGFLDLATGNFGSSVSILLGDGTGGFSGPTDFSVQSNPFSVAAEDFNRDSLLDLAIANHSSNSVSILLGLPSM